MASSARSKPAAIAALAPELTWYIGSLSKSLGAGLRLAHVIAPDQNAAWQFNRALRTASIMISPLTLALATRWIEDGTAAALLDHIPREESAARQALARRYLAAYRFDADPEGFHLWLQLGKGWTPSAFVSQVRAQPIGLVEGDAFAVSGPPPQCRAPVPWRTDQPRPGRHGAERNCSHTGNTAPFGCHLFLRDTDLGHGNLPQPICLRL